MCFAPPGRALFRHLNFQKCFFLTFWLENVLRSTTACTFSISQLPKMVFSTSQLPRVVREWCVLHIMAWKCASRHSGVPGSVLYILAWKCASRRNGEHFFDISTSKSGPRMVCVLYILTSNVLRATTACNFSSLIWPHGSAPAALASLLFDPPEPQIIGKT